MQSILIIGTGRLAFHLGHALKHNGLGLAGVAGRNAGRTAKLADKLGCGAFGLHGALPPAGMRVLAVSDDAIRAVAEALPKDGTPVIHLSGSNSLDLLQAHAHRGVMWPMHSFGTGEPADFSTIPLVIDADDEATLAFVRKVASTLSGHVVQLPMEQRQRLHLSAVMASNFPVFLLREASRLLTAHGIDATLLHPLWKTAAERALHDPDKAVTGPARRGDVNTMAKQLELLADEPELRRAYAALSKLILHTYHPETRGQQDL